MVLDLELAPGVVQAADQGQHPDVVERIDLHAVDGSNAVAGPESGQEGRFSFDGLADNRLDDLDADHRSSDVDDHGGDDVQAHAGHEDDGLPPGQDVAQGSRVAARLARVIAEHGDVAAHRDGADPVVGIAEPLVKDGRRETEAEGLDLDAEQFCRQEVAQLVDEDDESET